MSHSIPRRALRSTEKCLRQPSPLTLSSSSTRQPIPRHFIPNARSLTSTPTLHKAQRAPRSPRGPSQAAPAMFLRIESEMKRAQEGLGIIRQRDFGCPPDMHFIAPPPARLWGAARSSPRASWVLFKRWLQVKYRQAFTLLRFKAALGFLKWESGRREVVGVAEGLYKEVYGALASGEVGKVEDRLCEGLLRSCLTRVSGRAPGTRVRWALHRVVRKPKVMSFTCLQLQPQFGKHGNGVVQAVVRMHTVQSLLVEKVVTKQGKTEKVLFDTEGNQVEVKEGELPPNAKETVEYFVVQKFIDKGKPEGWMAQGMTEPTNVEKMIQDDASQRAQKKLARAQSSGTKV